MPSSAERQGGRSGTPPKFPRWLLERRELDPSGDLKLRFAGHTDSVKATLLALVCVVSTSLNAQPKPMPTDLELRAAYCLPLVESSIPYLQSLVTEYGSNRPDLLPQMAQAVSDRQADLQRLRAYLLPKIQSRTVDDDSGLMAFAFARKRGQADSEAIWRPNASPALTARISVCFPVTWLPF